LQPLVLSPQPRQFGALVRRERPGRVVAGVDVGPLDPLTQRCLGQVEVNSDLPDAPVADLAEPNGLGLERCIKLAPLPPRFPALAIPLVHGSLLAHCRACLGVHESGGRSGREGRSISWAGSHAQTTHRRLRERDNSSCRAAFARRQCRLPYRRTHDDLSLCVSMLFRMIRGSRKS
jgi:hypothetical protein